MSVAISRVVDEVFPRRDIGIYCPKCKKECVFEWVIFRNGERVHKSEVLDTRTLTFSTDGTYVH